MENKLLLSRGPYDLFFGDYGDGPEFRIFRDSDHLVSSLLITYEHGAKKLYAVSVTILRTLQKVDAMWNISMADIEV